MATGASPEGNRTRRVPQGRWRGRSLLWIVPLVLVIFVVASDLAGWPYLRQPLASLLSTQLDRRVEIGAPFSIRLRPSIPIRLGTLTIAAPDWSKEPHFVSAERVEVDLYWGMLLGRRPTLHRLAVGRADVRAERNQEGQASWSLGSDDPQPEDDGAGLPVIEALHVEDVQILVKDAQQDLSMEVAARTLEHGPEQKRMGEGAAGPSLSVTGKGNWKDTPIGFELMTAGALPFAPGEADTDVDLKATLNETKVAYKGTVSDLAQFRDLTGNVSAEGKSLSELSIIPGLALPSTPPFRLEGEVIRDGSSIKVDVTRAEIGSSSLTAKLEYDSAPATPTLRGTMNAGRLVLQDLGPTIGAGGGRKVLPAKPFDFQVLRAMNADVGVDLDRLDLGSDALRPVQSLKARLLLESGVLKLQDVTSNLADGSLTGSIVLDASASKRDPVFNADLRWKNVDLRKWLKGAGEGYIVAGRFSGQTQLEGSGVSIASILEGVEGKVRGQIQGGSVSHQLVEMAGLDVAEALGLTVTGDKPLQLTCALVDLTARKGILRSDLFLLNTADTLFFVQGSLNLGKERLNLRLVQAPKDWSPLSLRAPVTIGGTFDEPALGIEPVPAALKLLSSAVLAAVAPVAALLPLIDPGEKSDSSSCGAAVAKVKEKAAELGPLPGTRGAGDGKAQGAVNGNGTVQRPGRVAGERP